MKKIFFLLIISVLAFAACDGLGKKGKPLSPDQQKDRMEQIANDLMAELSATHFEEMVKTISDLSLSIENTFESESYDWSALEDVFEERYDSIFSYEELNQYESTSTYMLLFSQIKGHVTLGANAASYKNADNTVVEYKDDKGISWQAELTPKGTVKDVYLGEFIDEGYSYTDYINVTVSVPERLEVSLKKNGADYLTVAILFDVAISSGGVNIEKDRVSVAYDVNFNGLRWVLDLGSYNASSGQLEAASTITKDGKLIVSEVVSLVGKVDMESENWSGKDINVNVNVMDAMQIAGTCPDAKSLSDILDNAEPQSASDWERIVNNANAKFNLNVYYDGTSTVQAKIVLEPRWEVNDWGEDFWCEPILEFNDGSRYLFYEYFTEDSFDGVIDNAVSFVERYENMLERYFGSIF